MFICNGVCQPNKSEPLFVNTISLKGSLGLQGNSGIYVKKLVYSFENIDKILGYSKTVGTDY